MVHLVVWLSERLGDVDAELLLQENEDDHPVSLAPCVKIVLIEWSDAQKLKHLILVDILTHVAHDMRLEILHLEQLAEIDKVKLVLVSESKLVFCAWDVFKQMRNILVIFARLQIGLVIYHNLHLSRVFAVLLALRFIDVNGIEYALWYLKSVPLARLDQLICICINWQFFQAKGGNHLNDQVQFFLLMHHFWLLLSVTHEHSVGAKRWFASMQLRGRYKRAALLQAISIDIVDHTCPVIVDCEHVS